MRFLVYLLLLCCPVLSLAGSKQTATPPHSAGQSESQGRRSYLGVGLIDLTDDRLAMLKLDDDRGVEVTRIQPDSPAEKAGVKAGDILLAYNGENILSVQQLARLVAETPAGRKVRVQLWRGGKIESVHLTTAVPPDHLGAGTEGPGSRPLGVSPVAGGVIVNMPTPALVWRNFVLGIYCEPVESQLAAYFGVKRGLLVRSVDKDSLAERSGLQAGDVIMAIADRATETPQDLGFGLGNALRSAQNVPLSLMRDHKRLTVNLNSHE